MTEIEQRVQDKMADGRYTSVILKMVKYFCNWAQTKIADIEGKLFYYKVMIVASCIDMEDKNGPNVLTQTNFVLCCSSSMGRSVLSTY